MVSFALLANEVFQFFVRAEDHGSPVLGTEAPVDVLILDPQERAPTFERTSSKYFISESAPVGNDNKLPCAISIQKIERHLTIRHDDCESQGGQWQ